MKSDPRRRSITAHVTKAAEPRTIEWASPKQQEIFSYGPWPACASGGFGAAKTWAFCLKALWLSDTFPNNRGVIARREYEQLRHTTMSTFYKICPPEVYMDGGKRSDSEKYLKLNNGSEVLWMHMDDPETENVIRGLEINWFLLDQAEELEEEIFDLLMTRLGRWDKATVPGWMLEQEGGIKNWAWKNPATGAALVPTYPMIACNPDTELHWIYRRFHPESTEWQGKYKRQGYRMWIMSSEENRFLPKQNLELMLQKDESFVRRFVRGEWGIPEGQIHQVDPLSIIEGTAELVEWIKRSWTLHRTLDHGDAAPTCCLWWAVDQAGNVCAYREYYMPNKLVSDHRVNITEMSKGERYVFQFADPSIFFLTQQKHGGRWSTADEYSDCTNLPRETAIFWQPGDNNEMGTRNRISEYLRVDPDRVNPFTKSKGSPRLFFIKASDRYPQGCNHSIIQLKSQRRMRIGTDLGRPVFCDDRDDKIIDHAYDCCRYFIASRPPVTVQAHPPVSRKTFAGRRAELLRFKHAGGFRMLAAQAERMNDGR